MGLTKAEQQAKVLKMQADMMAALSKKATDEAASTTSTSEKERLTNVAKESASKADKFNNQSEIVKSTGVDITNSEVKKAVEQTATVQSENTQIESATETAESTLSSTTSKTKKIIIYSIIGAVVLLLGIYLYKHFK